MDSSALAKRYVLEAGSERVEAILAAASSLGVSVICLAEVISALCRRRREQRLTKQQYAKARQALLDDISDASVVYVTDKVVLRAVAVLEGFPLRSSDALHVASAYEWGTELFVSADGRQCTAAQHCALPVERLPN